MPTNISDKRLAANRANAAKSTGPRTSEGKAASSQNAVKHGFCSSTFAIVRLEELDEVAKLKAEAVACYTPVNTQELQAVERIALAQQQMLRAARLEAGLFTDAMNEALDRYNKPINPMDEALVGTGDIDICKAQNRNYCLAEGFRRMAKESNVWSLMLRYQSQAERMYRRSLEEFDRLKALRSQLPNEPNIGTQAEEKEELVSPEPAVRSSEKQVPPPPPDAAQTPQPALPAKSAALHIVPPSPRPNGGTILPEVHNRR